MEDRKEKQAPWLSVPQFGDWDQKGAMPDYSMDFSKIREMRKQNKRDPSRASLGNEEELFSSNTRDSNITPNNHQKCHESHSPTVCFLASPIFNSFSIELSDSMQWAAAITSGYRSRTSSKSPMH